MQGPVQQESRQYGGRPSHGVQSGTLVVRTKADKYLRRFSRFNFALAILAAFFGVLFVLVGNVVQEASAAPPEIDALFGVLYFVLFGFAALYAGVWYFSKRRSTIVVYLATAFYAIGTVVNLVTVNPLGAVVTALGAYWGYRSFGAV